MALSSYFGISVLPTNDRYARYILWAFVACVCAVCFWGGPFETGLGMLPMIITAGFVFFTYMLLLTNVDSARKQELEDGALRTVAVCVAVHGYFTVSGLVGVTTYEEMPFARLFWSAVVTYAALRTSLTISYGITPHKWLLKN